MAKLTDLKKLVDAARGGAMPSHSGPGRQAKGGPAVVKNPPAALARGDGDIDLAQAFADVQRLAPSTRASNALPRPAPIPRQRIADDADALTASKYGAERAPEDWDVGQEHEAEQTFLRRGLSSDILKKLRRGEWSVQAEIDLHGHRIDEAHDALSDFIVDARARGYRCVRAIHGKGLTSPNREPVLKGRVRRWLAHWDEVLAYCEAPPNAGGGGAVMILLRGK
jgi:DNA-nicking Smr family endonuclease